MIRDATLHIYLSTVIDETPCDIACAFSWPLAMLTDQFLATLGYALQRGMQLLFQVEQQEIALEQIGEGEDRRLLYWEAAEGGNGIWQRLIEDPDALARVAEKALDACHFDPSTGNERPGWADKCSRACYDCLLSYSNQPAHPLIDRHLIRDFLLLLLKSTTTKKTERSRDEQYTWLEERRDQNSSVEREFLKLLYETDRRLPDRAQHRPERRSTRKPIFIMTAMDCRVFVCFATDPTTTSLLEKSPTSVSGANLPTSAIAS